MFVVDDFIDECRNALTEDQPSLAVKEILARAVSQPGEVARAFPEPNKAEIVTLFASPEITLLRILWAPGMAVPPHDHLMWAAIGIYGGQEDNSFYRRDQDGIVPSGGKRLSEGSAVILGDDTVHAVANPSSHSYTAALHVYGGDYMNKPRSLWDPETLVEEPSSAERMMAIFEAANEVRAQEDDG